MLRIENRAQRTPPAMSLDPATIEFGKIFTPNFFVMEYANGRWQNPRIEPLHHFQLHPAALVFHYAQAVFEGLKAHQHADGRITLFRPDRNAWRLNYSCERMAMPPVDERLFVAAIQELVETERDWIPRRPGSLYVRPTLIATEACIGVRGATEFLFYILTLPAGSYFPGVQLGAGSVRVLVAESMARAAPGGTGGVKAAANYAVTLKITNEARQRNCGQVLFLDAAGQRRVEEMGGMNIFFVREGRLVTPPLTNTILPGITRESTLRLAADMGFPVEEQVLQFDDVIREIQQGAITEAIACGTAATLTGIRAFLFEDGREVRVGSGETGPVTNTLFQQLTGIQYGEYPDPYGWLVEVCRKEAPVAP